MNFLALKLTATCNSYWAWVSEILIQAHIFAINLVNFLAIKLTVRCNIYCVGYQVSEILIKTYIFARNFVNFIALRLTATCLTLYNIFFQYIPQKLFVLKQSLKEAHSFAPLFNLRQANLRRANLRRTNLRRASGNPPSYRLPSYQ